MSQNTTAQTSSGVSWRSRPSPWEEFAGAVFGVDKGGTRERSGTPARETGGRDRRWKPGVYRRRFRRLKLDTLALLPRRYFPLQKVLKRSQRVRLA